MITLAKVLIFVIALGAPIGFAGYSVSKTMDAYGVTLGDFVR